MDGSGALSTYNNVLTHKLYRVIITQGANGFGKYYRDDPSINSDNSKLINTFRRCKQLMNQRAAGLFKFIFGFF